MTSTQTVQSETVQSKTADTAAELHPLLADRWSPRGFDAGHALAERDLTALLEAARWSASAANTQPWRFLVTRRGEAGFDRLAALLMPGNQIWAPAASALLLMAAQTRSAAGEAQPWAHYDTGQAVAHLSTQAGALGLAVHQMGGFDRDAAAAEFGLEPGLEPLVVVALGRRDADAELPEALAARERAPRERRPLADLLLAG